MCAMLVLVPVRLAPAGGLVTIPDVELCRVGTWNASTGPVTFTLEDFAAAMAAEQDPEVWDAPVKLGHTDPRFAALDGEPALGWVQNLRVVGDRLRGDLVNVPAALASLIPTAWPRRSVEMAFDVHTPRGARYRAAVVGLALLGVTPPAVSGLADVLGMFEPDATYQVAASAAHGGVHGVLVLDDVPPQLAHVYAVARAQIGSLAALPGIDPQFVARLAAEVERMPGMPGSAPLPAPAGHTVPRAFVQGGPAVPLTDQRVREILNLEQTADTEAALVALRDRAATAAQQPGAPAGAPAPGQPAPGAWPGYPAAAPAPAPVGAQPYPGAWPFPGAPAPAPAAPAPPAYGYQPQPPAGYAPPAPAAPGQPAPAAQAPAAPAPGQPAPQLDANGQPVAQAPAAPAPGQAPAAPAPAGPAPAQAGTYVDPAAWAAMQAQAAAGAHAAVQLATQQRENALAAHCSRGAIRPADIAYWRGQYDLNPAGTVAHLAALPATFPTAPLGSGDPNFASSAGEDASWAAFYSSMGWEVPAANQGA
jgi:hypothetical protein